MSPASRYARPQPGSELRAPRGYGFADYGRVSGGYPAYGDPRFPDRRAAPARAQPAAAQEQARRNGEQPQAEDEEEFEVSEGFFFDNYTSGTGFGVYGGEAVSSGSGSSLTLPSAGNRVQELGFPTGPGANNGGQADTPDEED